MSISRFNTRLTNHYRSVVPNLQTLSLMEQAAAYADAHTEGSKKIISPEQRLVLLLDPRRLPCSDDSRFHVRS
jgi:hypothetical protein